MSSKSDTAKQIRRYYLFYGLNDYKLNERIASLVKAVVASGSESFDLDRFDGKSVELPVVVNAVSTPPVLSPLRVVALTSVDKLSAANQNYLESLLPKIPEYTVLAMTAAKPDKRSKLFKKLLAEDKIHSFNYEEYKPQDAAALAVKFAFDRGKKLSPDVSAMIVDIFGVEPYRLENEIEKLALFTEQKKEIEKQDLAFSAGFNRPETLFDLPDYIIKGQPGKALELTRRAIATGTNEMQILYILKNYLIGINAAQSDGDIKKIMSTLGTTFFRAKDYSLKARTLNQDKVLKGLTYIFRAEYSLKSSRFPSETVIELLVIALYLALRGNIDEAKLYLM